MNDDLYRMIRTAFEQIEAEPYRPHTFILGQEMYAQYGGKLIADEAEQINVRAAEFRKRVIVTDEDLRRLADAGWRLCDHGLTPDSETDWRRDGDTVSIRFYSRIHLLPPGELCGGWKATLPDTAREDG